MSTQMAEGEFNERTDASRVDTMKAVNRELFLRAELKKYAVLNEMNMNEVGRMLGWGNTTLYRKLGNTELITLAELRRLAQMIGRDTVDGLI